MYQAITSTPLTDTTITLAQLRAPRSTWVVSCRSDALVGVEQHCISCEWVERRSSALVRTIDCTKLFSQSLSIRIFPLSPDVAWVLVTFVYNSWSSQDRSNLWMARPGCLTSWMSVLLSHPAGFYQEGVWPHTAMQTNNRWSCRRVAKSGTELGKPVWPFKDLYRPFVFLPALLSPRCHYLPWTRRKMLRSQRTTPMTLTLNLVRFKLVLNLVKESSLVNSRIGTLQW